MSTVVRRAFSSIPQRDAGQTWAAIVELLVRGNSDRCREELLRVSGIASSIITDQSPKDAAIVVTCNGPRTRIYCLYDDEAIGGDGANEESLGFSPLAGEWAISLPCEESDLDWIQSALKMQSSRITAREKSDGNSLEEFSDTANSTALIIDQKGFLG